MSYEPKATATITVIENGYVMEVRRRCKDTTANDPYDKQWITREYCASSFAELGECLRKFLQEPKAKKPVVAARDERAGS